MRTREALIDAAINLAKEGRQPTIAEVAEAARVSPATAYRYFPSPQSLWADMSSQQATRRHDFLRVLDELEGDPVERIGTMVRETATMQFTDETLWRNILRATLERWFEQRELPESEHVPVRGTTRLALARGALEPLTERLSPERFEHLVNAVALVFGVEAMVSTRDTCGLDIDAATDLMVWSAQALVRQALAETEGQQPD